MRHLRLAPILPKGDACHVATSRFSTPAPTRLHDHDFLEIFLISEGTGWHLVNGRKLALEKGHLVLIRATDRHGFQVEDGGTITLTNIAFSSTWFASMMRLWPEPRTVAEWRAARMPPSVLLSADVLADLRRIALELQAATGARHLGLARFCLEALRHLDRRQRVPQRSPGPAWLEKAVTEMNRPDMSQQNVPWFQRRAGRSAAHFARMCRQHYGTTPTELLNRARIRRAQQWLTESDAKVIEVGFGCGFENLGYFYRTFRRLAGCTPRAWRRRAASVPR
jgi:AraC family cel operon transcriptional repressor